MFDLLGTVDRLLKADSDMKLIDYKEQIVKLRKGIVELEEELAAEKEKSLRLTRDVKNKNSSESLADILIYKDGVYMPDEDAGGYPAGTAFCPRCKSSEGKIMPLTIQSDLFQALSKYKCPECNEHFT